MKNLIIGALIAFLFAQCDTRQNSENILTPEQMVPILTDIHILESRINNLRGKNHDFKVKAFNSYQKEIYLTHNTTKEQYEKSYAYYAERPKVLEEIYTIVVDSLNVSEQTLKAIVDQEEEEKKRRKQAIKDSTARAEYRLALADTLDISWDSLLLIDQYLGFTLDSAQVLDSLIKYDTAHVTLRSIDSMLYSIDSLSFTLDSLVKYDTLYKEVIEPEDSLTVKVEQLEIDSTENQ